jgi:hypothetical protein
MKFLPETPDVLNSFAPETDLTAPLFAGHSTHAHLASDSAFIIHELPVPLAPVRAARGHTWRALAALAVLAAAAWAAYEYGFRRPLDFDPIAAWASSLVSPAPAARAPIKALPLDPPRSESPQVASNASAAPAIPDRTAAPLSNTSTTPAASSSLVSPVQNVSGAWRLDTQTEASDSSLEGLHLHYEITLAQDGVQVTGVGTKVSEGDGVAPGARTPVTMSGAVAGDRLTLNVVERGSDSETRGKIVLLVDSAGSLRGRFSSSAAPSSGHVEGRRVSAAP